jgi:hypothetical protein
VRIGDIPDCDCSTVADNGGMTLSRAASGRAWRPGAIIALVVVAFLVSGCSLDFTLERDVVNATFEESVVAMSATLGERDHGVDEAYEWHNEGLCGQHRHARWELTSLDHAWTALDGFAATARAAGIATGRFSDTPESAGISLMAYHCAGDGIDTGYVFSAFAEDAEAAAIRNTFWMSIADERTPAHLLPEGGWVYIDVSDNTECARPATSGLRPALDDEEAVATWLHSSRP